MGSDHKSYTNKDSRWNKNLIVKNKWEKNPVEYICDFSWGDLKTKSKEAQIIGKKEFQRCLTLYQN